MGDSLGVIRGLSHFYERLRREGRRRDGELLFKLLFAGGGIAFLTIGGFFAWFTQKGKVWAKCIFVVMCGYSAVDAILGPYALSTLTPTIFGPPESAISLVIALGWAYLAGLACYTRPNQSFQPTGSAGG